MVGWPDDIDMPIEVLAAFGADLTAHPSTWDFTDLTDRLLREPISLRIGRNEGATESSAGSASLLLDNDDWALTPEHPMSEFWPYVDMNVPVWLRLRPEILDDPTVVDTFTRTVSSSWGSTPAGDVWTNVGAGGTVAASDFNVNGTSATHSVPVAAAYRHSTLMGVDLVDIQATTAVSFPALPTGAPLETGLMLRVQDINTHYMCRAEVQTSGAVAAKIIRPGLTIATVTVPALTYTPGAQLRIRAQVVGQELAMRVWLGSTTEPDVWHLQASDTAITAAGGVGLYSGVASGNTNTKPVVVTYDNVEVWPFWDVLTGFADQWEPTFTPKSGGGFTSTVRLTMSGILRRLGQGSVPLDSALRRKILAASPIAYWSLEGGQDVANAESTIPGGSALTTFGAIAPRFGQADGPPGSDQLPDFSSKGALQGVVPTYADTGQWQVEIWFQTATGDSLDFTATVPIQWDLIGGTYPAADVLMSVGQGAGGDGLGTIGFDISPYMEAPPTESTRAGTSGIPPDAPFLIIHSLPNVQGTWRQLRVCMHQVVVGTVELSAYLDNVQIGLATSTSATLGRIGNVVVNPTQSIGAYMGVDGAGVASIGHVAIYDTIADPGTYQAGLGHPDEPASERTVRLCAEEGVPLTVTGEIVAEGFETASPAVTITGTWARDSTQAHSGAWSLRSAAIGHSASTDAVVTVPVGMTSLTYWYKLSSEPTFDFLRVLRDGVLASQASGEVGWTQRTISVAGISQVTFRYIKDSSSIGGSDAAWIDDLVFAGMGTPMGPQRSATLLELLRECEAADFGILYETRFGVGFRPRSTRYNLAPSMTVDLSTYQYSQGTNPDSVLAPKFDDQRTRNEWTVSRPQGLKATVIDAAHQRRTGRRDDSVELNLATDTVLADHAGWRVNLGINGSRRYPATPLDLAANPNLLAGWLTLQLGDRLTRTNPPPHHPPGQIDVLVEGYSTTLGPREWTVAANGPPALPWDVFVLDVDRLDADPSSQLVAGITATATTFQVQTAAISGALWTTNSAEWTAPKTLYINIAGEQMQVTNITGASSPQTFTVIRSVNGVVKTQKTGAYVGLWQPRVLAL